MKKSVVLMLCLALILCWAFACADGQGYWVCSNCGTSGNTGNFCPTCGSPAPVQAAQGTSRLEQIPGVTTSWKIRADSVYASGYIINNSDPSLWVPEHAIDGVDNTCWQFSTLYNPLGSVFFDLNVGTAQTIDALWFKNGFWSYSKSGGDLYTMNSRLKDIRVEFLYEGSTYGYTDPFTAQLQDDPYRSGWQKIELGRHTGVISVRIWVLSAYTGSKYINDVCLSEVMLVQNAVAVTVPYTNPSSSAYASNPSTVNSGVAASLKMRLSTRSGPGTEYDEPGSFFNKNWSTVTVQVMGKAWDGSNWWVLIDFTSGNNQYRVWTGLKRVNVNLDLVPEINPNGQGTIDATETRRGPGGNYAKGPKITHWKDVVAYGRENGYVEVEYYDYSAKRAYRFWVPEDKAHIDPPGSSGD